MKTFPITAHYDVGETLTSLGIGEALVTVLTPEGVPTPLAATRLVPPDSMMDAVDATTRSELIAAGALREKYGTSVDRESAHEILTGKLAGAAGDGGCAALPPPPRRGKRRRDRKVEPAQDRSRKGDRSLARKARRPRSRWATRRRTGIGLAKDLFTTADGRRTLRTVFGTLLGKK